MISIQQAIRVLSAQSDYCKHIVSTKKPEDKEYALARQSAEALDFVLFHMQYLVPKAPVFDPKIHSYRCSNCGCPVGFQIRPGIRCYACPQCIQRVDWICIDF